MRGGCSSLQYVKEGGCWIKMWKMTPVLEHCTLLIRKRSKIRCILWSWTKSRNTMVPCCRVRCLLTMNSKGATCHLTRPWNFWCPVWSYFHTARQGKICHLLRWIPRDFIIFHNHRWDLGSPLPTGDTRTIKIVKKPEALRPKKAKCEKSAGKAFFKYQLHYYFSTLASEGHKRSTLLMVISLYITSLTFRLSCYCYIGTVFAKYDENVYVRTVRAYYMFSTFILLICCLYSLAKSTRLLRAMALHVLK